ncbi:GntR family transcriptional regulator [Paenibacillus sp. GCM10027626]|uniref:GntR family transcriptional regulator n=1 Tax=Paenibacillus sp. GCM10027626 TaxID=3273411 RepID=UPI00363F368D
MTQPTGNQPLYLQIRAMLKEKIERGELQPGDQIPTEAELVQQYGVSRITIKNAIKLLVEEDLVYRIAGKGTFVADPAEAAAAAPIKAVSRQQAAHKRKIGFLSPFTNDEFSMQLLQSIEEACKEQNVILIVRTATTQSEERDGINFLLEADVDGLLIFPVDGEAYSDAILGLKSTGFPFVLVDRYLPGIKTNAVYSDNYQGGYLGTEYLIQKGHKRIGIVSGTRSKTSSSEDRFSGYLGMAGQAGLKIEPAHWLTRTDEITYMDTEASQRIVTEWLQSQPELTAVFAFSCGMAVYVARAASELGRKVPEELAILSYDNPPVHDLHGRYFSCIEQQVDKMGEEALSLLLSAIDEPSLTREVVLPVSIRERRTT